MSRLSFNWPKVRTLLLGLIPPAAILLLWNHAAQGHSFAFVPLGDIAATFAALVQSGELPQALAASLARAFSGLAFGAAAGTALGVLMGLWRPAEWALSPLYTALRQVPLLGWLPLIGLWFGAGDVSRTIAVAMSAFYPTVLYTFEGLKGTDARLIEVGRVYRLNPWQAFWSIRWPGALPSIFTGLFQALAFAWIATIGVELLFASGSGLGALMETAQLQARLDTVMAAIVVIGATGFLINLLILRLRRLALRWQPVKA